MNHIVARHNCQLLCQSNRRQIPASLALDIIRTHPIVIHRGVACRNMYHVPPDEMLGPNQDEREVERLLANLREREEVEQALDISVSQLRALAGRLLHAQDDERRRIAQMLHETTAQDLAALKMLLARLNRTSERPRRRRSHRPRRKHRAGREVDDRHPDAVVPAAPAVP